MPSTPPRAWRSGSHQHDGANLVVGTVDHAANGFDPHAVVTDFDAGTVSVDPDGRTVREWEVRGDREGGRGRAGRHVPRLDLQRAHPRPDLPLHGRGAPAHPLHQRHARTRIRCISTASIPGAWTACRARGWCSRGDAFVYEFDARPFGCHLYHCHALPLKRHIHKGMYGAFIIDPDPARHPEAADVARGRLLGSPENRAGRNS